VTIRLTSTIQSGGGRWTLKFIVCVGFYVFCFISKPQVFPLITIGCFMEEEKKNALNVAPTGKSLVR